MLFPKGNNKRPLEYIEKRSMEELTKFLERHNIIESSKKKEDL
jgi:hypothetical protein